MAGGLDAEKAVAEVGEVGGGVRFGASGGLHEVLREEGGAVLVDVFLHPAEEGEEVAFGEGGGNGGVVLRGVEELGGVDVAEGVGREVAEAAHGPMDVLEAAFGVVFGFEAEEFFEGFVPGGGDVGDLEFAGEEGALELETEKDVEVVGGFVGLHADAGVGGSVDADEELVEVEFLKVGEELVGAREPFFPEGATTADVVFPESGLGFVNAEGDGLTGGEVEVGGGEALFVEAVAGFVHDAEEGGGEVVFVVAGGEADVGGAEGGAEGVGGGVDAAALEVEAERFGDFVVEGLLGFDGGGAVEVVERDGGGGFDGGRGDFGDFAADGVKEGGDFGGFGTTFVFGKEGVVGLVFVSPVLGFFAGDGEELVEMGREGGEVVVFASLAPGRFGEGGGFGIAFDKFGGELGGAFVLVGEFSLVGACEGGESVTEPVRCAEIVNTSLEVGELFGAEVNRSRGGEGFLVPVEGGGGGGEEGDFAKEVLHGGSLAKDRGGNSPKVKVVARSGEWTDGRGKTDDAE